MDGGVLLNSTGGNRKPKGAAETSAVHGVICCWRGIGLAGPACGKQPDRMPMSSPMHAKHLESGCGQGNITIFVASSRPNMEHHAGAIDLGLAELESFLEPQATGIDDGTTDPILVNLDLGQDAPNILRAEHNRELVFFGGTD